MAATKTRMTTAMIKRLCTRVARMMPLLLLALVASCARAPITPDAGYNQALELARQSATRGELDSARQQYLDLLAGSVGSTSGDVEKQALTLRLLARVEHQAGDYARAESLLLQALDLVETRHGKDDARVGWIASELGPLYQSTTRLAEAEYFHRRALELLEPVLEPSDAHLSILLNNLGSVLVAQERHDEAVRFIERAHELAAEGAQFGDDRPTALFLVNLADTYRQMGRLADAEAAYKSALAAQRVELGYRANFIAMSCLDGLAEIEADRGELRTATTLLRAAIGVGERILEAAEGYEPGMSLYDHTHRQLERIGERYREIRALIDGNWV
jgi:tetratricopeptide (TPR) repeat protein